MEILRAKTLDLRQTRPLSPERQDNSRLNEQEALAGQTRPQSAPRRLVLELTNACNLRCVMCGRTAQDFRPTAFNFDWLSVFEPVLPRVEEVTLMGWGEPTIHPRFVDFLSWAKRFGLRKYFCTNGMRLKELEDHIFGNEVDIIAVSLDGASAQTNETIRRGSDFSLILKGLERITNRRVRENLPGPYLNFVFTAMSRNLAELPGLVRLAADLGLDEVKAVYFTAFSQDMASDTLFGRRQEVAKVFAEAEAAAEKLKVALKLPHLEGDDPAGPAPHKPCYTAWRDLFLGSDGFFRPCMSTAQQFFPIISQSAFPAIWNSPQYQTHRQAVNDPSAMPDSCRHCYQSSFANWNQPQAFIQVEENFAPKWRPGL